MSELSVSITNRLEIIRENIALAARKAGRDSSAIKIVAVSKGQPVEVIQAAIEAGIFIFGENYPEETQKKARFLETHSSIEWHMIGHLQSRKIPILCGLFSYFHSMDRLDVLPKINEILVASGKILPILIEVNVSGEHSKGGITFNDSTIPQIIDIVHKIKKFPNIRLSGLMTMPPISSNAEDSRVWFKKLRLLQENVNSQLGQKELIELSMGTSFDYEIAVEEGATLVRIGSALLGSRKPLP